jgi:hypothetical protein
MLPWRSATSSEPGCAIGTRSATTRLHAPQSLPRQTENAFLYEFDVTYRVRRLSYLLQRLREFQLNDAERRSRTSHSRAGAT